MKSNRIGVILKLLQNCAESCTVCIDVLTIPGAGACTSESEVVLSVLASGTADVEILLISPTKRDTEV